MKKFTIAQRIQAEMIEADLMQGWECLSNAQFDLAIHHFNSAAAKTAEMRDAFAAEASRPKPKQLDIDIP